MNLSSRSQSILAISAAVVVALLLFGSMFGFSLPLASNPFWVTPHNDMAAMTAGYEAILREPWSLRPTLTDRINAPTPISIVFTDSIPWLALVLKASGMGPMFNQLGVFLLISAVMQAVSMGLLLRALGVTRALPLFAGCVLALLYPAWMTREYGHTALSGHWILILGLAAAADSIRNGLTWKRIAAFGGLFVLATGIHAYNLPPLSAAFGAALLSELLQKRPGALKRGVIGGAAAVAATLATAKFLAYGSGRGQSGGGDALGFYSMNILGPVRPQGSALAGQEWTGAWFTGVVDPNGGQWYEGFNYLGGGVLLLIAAGAVLTAVSWSKAWPEAGQVRRWGPLVLAAVGLFIYAVGPVAYLGDKLLFSIPRPEGKAGDVIGLFRAHGRFFWMTGYLLLAASTALIDRRAGRWAAPAVLILALGLQAYDTAPVRQGAHETFATPSKAFYPLEMAKAPQLRGRPFVFVPGTYCAKDVIDRVAISQLSLMAVRLDGASNAVPTARGQGEACIVPADLTRTAAPGDERITVVVNQGARFDGDLTPFAARTDCWSFLRGLMCGRNLQDVPGLIPAPAGSFVSTGLEPATVLRTDNFQKPAALKEGWAAPEGSGLWSQAKTAVIELSPDMIMDGFMGVELTGLSYATPPKAYQDVGVTVNGVAQTPLQVETNNWRPYRIAIAPELVKPGQPVVIVLSIPGAEKPSAEDPRLLGVGLQKITLLKRSADQAAATRAAGNTQ